jgi:diketogulonate reductase-like aldo/keto reductase
MARINGAWRPDGRARSIRADCEASLADLDGLAIDLYLLHTPDPRTSWRTSVRALARLIEDGLVRRVGLSNVNRAQLEEALALAPVAAVEVPLSPFDDNALRGGVLDRCLDVGIALIAHSPLGGPRRAPRLGSNAELARVADSCGATLAEVALAWILALAPNVVAIPGARRPETARSAARAARLTLAPTDRALLERALGRRRRAPATRRTATSKADVVLIMGIPGAGKSRVADEYVARGYARLNRDERGGALHEIADALDDALSSGERKVVLDNTYLTRRARSCAIDAAARHRVAPRCVWLDTPLAHAQVNLVERLLDRFGSLPEPQELKRLSRSEPGVMAPTSQMRALRELEPAAADEGLAHIEQVPFERVPDPDRVTAGVFVAAAASERDGWERAVELGDPAAPHLIFDWRPGGTADDLDDLADRLADVVGGPVEAAVCPHPGGPPTCWCRPPLPGLLLGFARTHRIDPARSLLVGTTATHRTLARTLGARLVAA